MLSLVHRPQRFCTLLLVVGSAASCILDWERDDDGSGPSSSSGSGGADTQLCTGDCECAAGQTCQIVCNGPDCDVTCGAGSDCTVVCAAGNCDVFCGNAQRCTVVHGGGSLDVVCQQAALCQVTGSAGGDANADVNCSDSPSCEVLCTPEWMACVLCSGTTPCPSGCEYPPEDCVNTAG